MLLWQLRAPFVWWAIVSALLGLGFTFFSGATEAWLVDALTATRFEGQLEGVFARGQVVGGAMMLSGSVAGGYLAQLTNLGVPYVARAAILIGMFFVLALFMMHDLGFTPDRGDRPLTEMKKIVAQLGRARPEGAGGPGNHAGRDVQRWGRDLCVLRPAAIPVEPLGQPQAYGIAGLVAAIVAGAQIIGGLLTPRIRRPFRRRTSALLICRRSGVRAAGADRAGRQLLGGRRA